MPLVTHPFGLTDSVVKAVFARFSFQIHIPIGLNRPLMGHDYYWNGMIFVDYFEYQREISMLICCIQRAHCFGPNLHTRSLFFSQIADQKMRNYQRSQGYHHGNNNEQNAYLTQMRGPFHIKKNAIQHDLLFQMIHKTLYLHSNIFITK